MASFDEMMGAGWEDSVADDNGNVEYKPLSPGWYKCMVDAVSDPVPAKTNPSNIMLKCTFAVCEGEYSGRKIFTNLNIVNTNEVAQAIGRRELLNLKNACGAPMAKDTSELLMKVIEVKVAIGEYEGKPRNDVKAFRGCGAAASAVKPAPAPVTAPAAPAGAKPKMPWEK